MTPAPTTPLGHRRRAACQHCRTVCASWALGSIDWDDPAQRCPISRWPAPVDGRPAPDLPPTRDLRAEVRRMEAELRGELPPPPGGGPGTELKRLLGRIGIKAHADCACESRAAEMDLRGPDWCEEHIDTILDWLSEEAARRRLPYIRPVARQVVRLAVKKARRKAPA